MLVDPRSAQSANAEFQRYLDRREADLYKKLWPVLAASIRLHIAKNGVQAEAFLRRTATPILRKHIERIYAEQFVSVTEDLEGKSTPFENLVVKRDYFLPFFMSSMVEYIAQYAASQVVTIAQTQQSRLRDIILRNVEAGKSNAVIAKEIRALAPKLAKHQAATIARTETHNAALSAIEDSLKHKNIEVRRKQWVATLDERVRPSHEEVNGTTLPYDEPFEVGDSQMMRPGDDSLGAGPEEIINCRCSLLFLTGGPEPPAGEESSAADLYQAPTKTPDDIIAEFGAKEAIEKVEADLAKLVSTDKSVAVGGYVMPDGSYTTARQALHKKIIDDVLSREAIERATPISGAPTFTVLGGRGGSGKSWLTGEHGPVDASKAILIDADHIKGLLPEYKGSNAAQVHEESSYIVDLIHRRASSLGVNVIHDATLKSLDSAVERLETYMGKGYQAEGYYMYLSPDQAATRALGRYAKGGTFSGRYVPPKIILGNTQNEKNFDKLSKRFVNWGVYDNSGKSPRLVSASKRRSSLRPG